MTNVPASLFPFTIPLTAVNHQIAAEFQQQHSDLQKATQVYLNTLSVQAVNFYLTCLRIKTSLAKSQSWNPVLQVLVDSADLWVEGLGRLECHPLVAETNVCLIPPQVLAERIGYVVVRLNSALTEAALLGFVPSVETAGKGAFTRSSRLCYADSAALAPELSIARTTCTHQRSEDHS